MNMWSTFKYVPAVSSEAVARAIVSMATYLAALEFEPVIAGRVIDPLALAVCVQFVLLFVKNLSSARFGRAFRAAPVFASLLIMASFGGIVMLALFGSAALAAKITVIWVLGLAFCQIWALGDTPETVDAVPSIWVHQKANRENAMLIEASGLVVIAAALVSVWTFAGPLAFVAMMGAGALIMRVLVNWIIVLYLLDAHQRQGDDRP